MISDAKQNFLKDLGEVLETDASLLSDDYRLREDTWDSLTVVSCASIIHLRFGVFPPGEKLEKCRSVGDIFAVIETLIKSQKNG